MDTEKKALKPNLPLDIFICAASGFVIGTFVLLVFSYFNLLDPDFFSVCITASLIYFFSTFASSIVYMLVVLKAKFEISYDVKDDLFSDDGPSCSDSSNPASPSSAGYWAR